jgi:hypothetical protein
MKRPELIKAAKLLGIPASGTNGHLLASIERRLVEINAALRPQPVKPINPKTGARLARGRKLEDGRKGLHPITGKPVY